jgi:four helix bundle protein
MSKSQKYQVDLSQRLIDFSINTIQFLSRLPRRKEFNVFIDQLSKSATSIGANYAESQASSQAEFRHRINICLKEAKETLYWYQILKEILSDKSELCGICENLLTESKEISLIFGSIYQKGKK